MGKWVCVGMAISRVNRVTRPAPPLLGRVWDKLIEYGTGMGKLCETRIGFLGGYGFVVTRPAPELELPICPEIL